MLRLFRRRARPKLRDQVAALVRTSGDLARQMAEIAQRLALLEEKVNGTVDWRNPPVREVGELSVQVSDLAEAVSRHGVAAQSALSPATPDDGPRKAGIDGAAIAEAIADNRIELYLQPIVTLPQRKVRYYEALSRMRTEQGDVVPAIEFIEVAEKSGLMPKLDNLLIFRCVQVMRRLQMKNREVGLFCNVSATTLQDPIYFKQFLDFMDANRVLGPSMMLEFTHAAYRGFGPLENEALASLAERGFRFSLDHVSDLRLEPKELADRGFRFVKVPANLLLSRIAGAQSDIHPADLADLLARSGIDLIGERVESENMVVDLLDYDVRFGQGFLFSPPRPVRAEALQGDPGEVAAAPTGEGGSEFTATAVTG